MKKDISSSGENWVLWLVKTISGVLIVALLGVHFVVNHLVPPAGLLTYTDIVRYYRNPLIPLMEGAFLVLVVGHALIGVRSILLDLHPSGAQVRWIDRLLIFTGFGAVVYGIRLLVIIATRPL